MDSISELENEIEDILKDIQKLQNIESHIANVESQWN